MGYIFVSALGFGPMTAQLKHRQTHAEEQVKTCKYLIVLVRLSIMGACSLNSLADPVRVFERAAFAFVLQASTVEAALLSLAEATWVVWEGTVATRLTVSPCLEGGKKCKTLNKIQNAMPKPNL